MIFFNMYYPILIFIFILNVFGADPDECRIHVKDDMGKKAPLVLQMNPLQYVYPSTFWQSSNNQNDDQNLVYKKGGFLHIFCPGDRKKDGTRQIKEGVILVKGTPVNSCALREIKCIGDNKFEFPNTQFNNVEFKDITCDFKGNDYPAIMYDTKESCIQSIAIADPNAPSPSTSLPTTRIYKIGYELSKVPKTEKIDQFITTIELCHNTTSSNTLWAHSYLIPENQDGKRYTGSSSPSFKDGSLFKKKNYKKPKDNKDKPGTDKKENTDTGYYSKIGQWKTAEFLLGSNNKADVYFYNANTRTQQTGTQPNGTQQNVTQQTGTQSDGTQQINANKYTKYLAKGHLIAKGDKFYKSEQDSTYYFANTLPMWQSINAIPGYWFLVESIIRKIAGQKRTNLKIWSGGIGILELEGVDSKQKSKMVPFYLDPIRKTNLSPRRKSKLPNTSSNKVPVPKIIFKVVVNDKINEEAAMVFLVVNHPKLDENNLRNYEICKVDTACQAKLLRQGNTQKHGYVYCCKLNDFYNKHAENLGLKDQLNPYIDFEKLDW